MVNLTRIAMALMLVTKAVSSFTYQPSACNDLSPSQVTAPESTADNPYNFTIKAVPFQDGYRVEGLITSPSQSLSSVFVTTACKGCIGYFCSEESSPSAIYVCDTGYGLTAKNKDEKKQFAFYWIPESNLQRPVQFIASVVYNDSQWWNNVLSSQIDWDYPPPTARVSGRPIFNARNSAMSLSYQNILVVRALIVALLSSLR